MTATRMEGQSVAAGPGVAPAAQQLLANARDHYMRALRESRRARAYLRSRGISRTFAAKFGVGYARDDWQGLMPVLRGSAEADVDATGLVARRPDGTGYDRFRDRLMFPIRNAAGTVVGFGGRALDDTNEVKYLNTPESLGFRKRELLFGLWEASPAIKASGQVIVQEGYVDVIASVQAGVENVVATLGTACTLEQLQQLVAMASEVVFCFDGDAAGRRAAERALEAVLPMTATGVSVRFAFLPEPHDPDSLIRKRGVQALREAVAAAVPLSAYLEKYVADGCNLDQLEGRVKAAARAGALWRTLPDGGALAQGLLTHCVQTFGISAAALLASWRRRDHNGANPSRNPKEHPSGPG